MNERVHERPVNLTVNLRMLSSRILTISLTQFLSQRKLTTSPTSVSSSARLGRRVLPSTRSSETIPGRRILTLRVAGYPGSSTPPPAETCLASLSQLPSSNQLRKMTGTAPGSWERTELSAPRSSQIFLLSRATMLPSLRWTAGRELSTSTTTESCSTGSQPQISGLNTTASSRQIFNCCFGLQSFPHPPQHFRRRGLHGPESVEILLLRDHSLPSWRAM